MALAYCLTGLLQVPRAAALLRQSAWKGLSWEDCCRGKRCTHRKVRLEQALRADVTSVLLASKGSLCTVCEPELSPLYLISPVRYALIPAHFIDEGPKTRGSVTCPP